MSDTFVIATREIGDPFELYFSSSHCSAVFFLNTLRITPTYLYPLNAGVTKLNFILFMLVSSLYNMINDTKLSEWVLLEHLSNQTQQFCQLMKFKHQKTEEHQLIFLSQFTLTSKRITKW